MGNDAGQGAGAVKPQAWRVFGGSDSVRRSKAADIGVGRLSVGSVAKPRGFERLIRYQDAARWQVRLL